jgi:hypothetical protein
MELSYAFQKYREDSLLSSCCASYGTSAMTRILRSKTSIMLIALKRGKIFEIRCILSCGTTVVIWNGGGLNLDWAWIEHGLNKD